MCAVEPAVERIGSATEVEGLAMSVRDAAKVAAETFAIAWEKRDKLDPKDCRPWLITTARNLLGAEYRSRRRTTTVAPEVIEAIQGSAEVSYEIESLNADVDQALKSISEEDQEALLLVAWDDLTPAQAAKSLSMSPVAFRVRLHRARKRFTAALDRVSEKPQSSSLPDLEGRP